ncbi:unnamed protein product [Trichobilharzia szidati]|nr:unnamed protein product [Trichobilharzia szidati]
MLNTFCGSFAYVAPEVLANKEYSGSAADIWSMGVILYALLCGRLPFDPTKPEELQQTVGKGLFAVPDGLSKTSRHLLNQMICVDPKKRIKMDDLRRHPWVVEGFMGHPVDLDEEKIPMSPLNMQIVAEITAYTRIPKVELARMLQKRPYDYIMATYMIMESVLEEEDVFIRLQRRSNGLPSNNPLPPSRRHYTLSCRQFQSDKISGPTPTSTPLHCGGVGGVSGAGGPMIHSSVPSVPLHVRSNNNNNNNNNSIHAAYIDESSNSDLLTEESGQIDKNAKLNNTSLSPSKHSIFTSQNNNKHRNMPTKDDIENFPPHSLYRDPSVSINRKIQPVRVRNRPFHLYLLRITRREDQEQLKPNICQTFCSSPG